MMAHVGQVVLALSVGLAMVTVTDQTTTKVVVMMAVTAVQVTV
jgi:hypothetical protein